ncbi:DUF1178 family protein [Tepidimonas charontis]|uniref:Uncharacterized protein n=1 Tax=Tepidimonas charontis TaxID=2267262 RepID=A0A554XCY0_9BURK|nr:DUF1178 family protein [Tepidimonas charontis]TSE33639.1 hypothetical protein Tchar_01701 [Tepidimonas charontis]
MKVLDLSCAQGHVFEGWFGSEEDYLQQRRAGLLECPVCGDRAVDKRLSAPYVHTARAASPAAPPAANEMPRSVLPPEQQARLLRALRALVRDSEDVGERFADEARAMHHGEIPARSIRGQATREQALALLEEGVPVLPLPDTPLLKEPLQ